MREPARRQALGADAERHDAADDRARGVRMREEALAEGISEGETFEREPCARGGVEEHGRGTRRVSPAIPPPIRAAAQNPTEFIAVPVAPALPPPVAQTAPPVPPVPTM